MEARAKTIRAKQAEQNPALSPARDYSRPAARAQRYLAPSTATGSSVV